MGRSQKAHRTGYSLLTYIRTMVYFLLLQTDQVDLSKQSCVMLRDIQNRQPSSNNGKQKFCLKGSNN